MEKIKAAGKGTVKGVAIFVMAFLFVVLFYLFCSGFFNYKDAAFLYSVESPLGIGCLCMLAVLFFVLFYHIAGGILSRCSERTLKIICFCLVFIALSVQFYFLFYVRSYYKWDSGFVIGAAASLAEQGRVADEAFYYMSVYPNQNTFVLITAALVKLGNLLGISVAGRPLLFNLFNMVCLDLSVFLVFPIMKRIRPNLSGWKLCRILLVLLCNPFLYVGVSYYYTITLSLPLSQGFLYLILSFFRKESRGKEAERVNGKPLVFKMVLAGILLGIGYELRATAIIFAIGVLVTGVWMLVEGCYKKRSTFILALSVMALTALLAASGMNFWQKDYVGIDTTDTAFPTSHWLMMSLTMPGSHNGEDEAYTASFPTREEKVEAVKIRMKEKLEAMDSGEYLTLIKTKMKNTFGTGMNGYTTFLADALYTDGVFEEVFGSRRDAVVLWHQGYYLFIMLGILLALGGFIRDTLMGKEIDFCVFLQALILLGAILFYVLWEASEQYSVPFMMLMGSLGLTGYSDCGSEKHSAQNRLNQGLSFLAFGAAAFIFVFGIYRFRTVTEISNPWSHPVAVQILANTSYPVDDGTEMVQNLQLSKPFNRLIIQWRNPARENSTAVYRVSLRERDSGRIVFKEEIRGEGTGYNGAGIYDFERVVPEGEAYELSLEKTGGNPEDDLEFVIYDMYGYQPYPAGSLYLNEKKENGTKKEMTASLLFSVSEEYQGSYMGKIKYIISLSLLFLIFLFMGFWCKLNVVSFYRGGKRND